MNLNFLLGEGVYYTIGALIGVILSIVILFFLVRKLKKGKNMKPILDSELKSDVKDEKVIEKLNEENTPLESIPEEVPQRPIIRRRSHKKEELQNELSWVENSLSEL